MSVKLLTEHHLEFLNLKGSYTGSSESTLVKCHIIGNHMSQLKLCLDRGILFFAYYFVLLIWTYTMLISNIC